MIARITHKTPREEVSRRTRTFDVVGWVRARRLQWAGHILRMHHSRMVHRAVQYLHSHSKVGDILMDVPKGFSWGELIVMASNRDAWRERVRSLKRDSGVVVAMNDKIPGDSVRCIPAQKPKVSTNSDYKAIAMRRYIRHGEHVEFFKPNTGKRKRGRHHQRKERTSKWK